MKTGRWSKRLEKTGRKRFTEAPTVQTEDKQTAALINSFQGELMEAKRKAALNLKQSVYPLNAEQTYFPLDILYVCSC